MKNDLKIKEVYIEHFEEMIKSIKLIGKTWSCPIWNKSLVDESLVGDDSLGKCNICKGYFKKIVKTPWKCPCSHYTPKYLIRFLKKVIANSQ